MQQLLHKWIVATWVCFIAAQVLNADSLSEDTSLQPLDVAHLNAEWVALFAQLHAVERVAAPFAEERFFAFRKTPKTYRGAFRKTEDGRVSLAYAEPEEMSLHLGDGFAYYRKSTGSVRQIPSSNSQSEALALFPQLLNFNLKAIAEFYTIRGELNEAGWRLVFDAKDAFASELSYAHMKVAGVGIVMQRMELLKNAKQRIVITMGDPVYPEFYLPEIKEKYFFSPATK